MSESELDVVSFIRKMRDYLKQSRDELRRSPVDWHSVWRQMAGRHLDGMLSSRAGAEHYLQHDSWEVRMAAMSVLDEHWKLEGELTTICERMALDPHPKVRGVALYLLACCYRGTRNSAIGNRLARLVHDEQAPEVVRRAAYDGLFQLAGVPITKIPLASAYRFPQDVKWDFVDSFLKP